MTEFLFAHLYELFWALAALCLLWLYMHHRRRILAFLLGSVTGLAALILLHFYGGAIGFAPPLNLTNLACAAILGVPGTLLLMAGQFFI